MIRNYIVSAFRNLKKTFGFSLINILGLAFGVTACLLILYYVRFENSYDRYHPDNDQIYRIRYERHSNNGTSVQFASCSPPAADLLKEKIPEIEKIAKIFRYKATVLNGEIKFPEERMYFAESDFLKIYDINMIEGDPETAIANANTAIISQSTAKKYFPVENPIGKHFSVDQKIDFIVTGIYQDPPPNTHLKMDLILAYPSIRTLYSEDVLGSWGHTGFFTYVILQKGVAFDDFRKKLNNVVDEELGDAFAAYDLKVVLEPQLMTDIHLKSHFLQEYEANNDEKTVRFMLLIAFVILVIAWVNYINLGTARAIRRAREVGLRKVIGASQKQLVVQFFTETILVNTISILIAFVMIIVIFPYFCRLSGIPANIPIWQSGIFYLQLAILFVISIILSGIYPAIIQTSFKPIAVIRGKLGNSTKGIGFRKILVLVQFSIAFVLLVGTLTIFRQIKFMQQQSLGFNIDQVMVLKAPRIQGENIEQRFESFKDEIRKFPNIVDIAFSSEVPGRQIYWDNGGIFPVGSDYSKNKNYMIMGIDYEFMNLYDLNFLSGRNFSREHPGDPDALILNETAMHWLEFESPDQAIGKQINYWGKIYTVIGVVSDYHHESPKAQYEPTIFRFMTNSYRGMYSMKISASDIPTTIKQIESTWQTFFPDNPFSFFFLDEYFDQQYHADERFGTVIRTFTAFALFVTCLGIFGLTVYNASQRRKEIGIRKVLGASIPAIVFLLVKDLAILIGLSTILMAPLALLGMRNWLNGFTARTEIGADLFLIPLLMLVIVTGLTVAFQSFRAAAANPVDSIKYE